MRKRIESVFWFFIDYGPTILTIAFAAYVVALAQTTPVQTEVVLQWILAILGLLAISELVERFRKLRHIERMSSETLTAIQSKLGERGSAEDFFMRRLPPLASYFEKADDVRMSGVVLQRTIRDNISVLERQLRDGAAIRVILIDPEGEAARRIANPETNFPLEHLKSNSAVTLQHLKWLAELPAREGSVELRYMEEEPYFNIIAVDSDKEYGVILVEFYPQRWTHGGRPRIELTSQRDGYWFGYFRDQFDRLWEDGKPVSLQNSSE